MPTLRDIAKRSGVSVSTVSRVLNGHKSVSSLLVEKVLNAASELGYEKRFRKLEKQTMAVLVTWPSISPVQTERDHHFAMRFVHSIYVTAEKLGYNLKLYFGTREGELNPLLRWEIATKQFTGAIIVGSYFNMEKNYIHHLKNAEIPFFRLSKAPVSFRTPHSYVAVDDYEGGYKATQHLLSFGIKRLLHIAGPLESRDALERKKGFIQACKDHGVTQEQFRIFQGDFHEPTGERCAEEIIEKGEIPEGIFAANDMMAIGCMRTLKRYGLKVPQDIRFVGFDDIMLASYVEPGLTTIRIPFGDIARVATEELIKQIDFPMRKNTRVLLDGELIIRGSCGASQKQ